MELILEDKLKRRYSFGETEVFCGNGIIQSIPPTLKTIFEDGAICVVYDKNLSSLADEMCTTFKRNGYRTHTYEVNDSKTKQANVPEYIRFVFAIGAGKTAEQAKRIAKKLDTDWAMFLSAPSTDTILSGFAPKQVFIDENVIFNCPNECIAAGWGIVLSEPLRVFESYFAHKVLSESKGVETGKLKELAPSADAMALAVKLLEISYYKHGTDTAQIMAQLLWAYAEHKGVKPRLIGEYKFVAGALLCAFYSAYLGSPSIDVMPPACREESMETVYAIAPQCYNRCKSIDFFDVNSYFRISYILGEYRMDLLEKLSGIDTHTTQRFWRRLYPDAGYWLKSALSSDVMLRILAMAGELSEGLLGFANASGFTQSYLKCGAKASA